MMRYRFGRMEFGRLVVRGAGYLARESLGRSWRPSVNGYSPTGSRARVSGDASDRAAHQARGHTVALCSSALTIHARPSPDSRHHPRLVQPLHGRRTQAY